MSKKLIFITASAGLVSFAVAFVLGWFTIPFPPGYPDEPIQPEIVSSEGAVPEIPHPVAAMTGVVGAASDSERKTMTEKQLRNLVFEVREKVNEYDDKLQNLALREQRLQRAQDTLKEDIQNLNNLRIELATIVADIKSERDNLLKTRLEITQTEKNNLVLIAAIYDKMDSASASEILVSMCTSQTQPNKIDIQGRGFDEAVKILYYMTERTTAKLLAELTTAQPKLAASLTQRLRQIVEGE